jgi:hypothetical protein
MSFGAYVALVLSLAARTEAGRLAARRTTPVANQTNPLVNTQHAQTLSLSLDAAAALRSVLHDIDNLPLDGKWVNGKKQEADIEGSDVKWETGDVWTIEEAGEGKFAITIAGKKYMAKLDGDRLLWSDGDVWVRKLSSLGDEAAEVTVEEKEAFLTRCTRHIQLLVTTLDYSYTDAQLRKVLEDECQMAKEFPATKKSRFRSHEACMEFAGKLADAREKAQDEEREGKKPIDPYRGFCEDYHDHVKR